MRWGSMDWIELAQDRDRWLVLVNAAMDCRIARNAGNFLTSSGPVNFSNRALPHGWRSELVGLFVCSWDSHVGWIINLFYVIRSLSKCFLHYITTYEWVEEYLHAFLSSVLGERKYYIHAPITLHPAKYPFVFLSKEFSVISITINTVQQVRG